MTIIQVLGSGLLTLIGGYFGFKLGRRADIHDRKMEQVSRAIQRVTTVIDYVHTEFVAKADNAIIRQTALLKLADWTTEDVPEAGSLLMIMEVGAELSEIGTKKPDETIDALKALLLDYISWKIRGRPPRWTRRVVRRGNAQIRIRRAGLEPVRNQS